MAEQTPIRVIVVDDHPVVRFGLAAMIGLQPDMAVVGEAGSGEEACELCAKKPADVVLMDLRLPGLSGVEAIRALRKTHPRLRFIVRQRFAAVLEERNRLTREMHDTLIQGCVGVSAVLEAASSAQE
ncbi:MAG: response regulator, partial [Bryobacteraceae bacterium]